MFKRGGICYKIFVFIVIVNFRLNEGKEEYFYFLNYCLEVTYEKFEVLNL